MEIGKLPVQGTAPRSNSSLETTNGYKLAVSGKPPEDWESTDLGELERVGKLRLGRGKVISQKDIVFFPGDYPIYSSSVKENGLFGHYGEYMFDEELITWSVDGGGNFFYRPQHRFSVTNVCGYLYVATDGLDYRFLAYQLQLLHSRQTFDYQLKAHPSVIRRAYTVLLPNIGEQRAIAIALSDVDRLIEALDALIAKKRAIKLAAMQQLLTGRTRLPGFEGKWTTKRLEDVADISNGGTPSTNVAAYWDGGINWCTPTDISSTCGKYLGTTLRTISEAGLQSCSARLFPPGTLLLCSRATIGDLKISTVPICTNQGFKSLVAKHGIDNEFLYYLLLTLKPKMIEKAIGSTFLEISKESIESLDLLLPGSTEEQQSIAAVFSDMDDEIATLERKRDKTKDIKLGMMQALLTGHIRLPSPTINEVAS